MKDHNFCPTCGHIVDKREISLYKGLVVSLIRVFNWCEAVGTHEFEMKDVKHMLGQINYTRWGDWVLFGGLVYKRGKAKYGMNMERCAQFFEGRLEIPTRIIKDPLKPRGEQLEMTEYRFIHQIPKLGEFLDAEGLFVPVYHKHDDPIT